MSNPSLGNVRSVTEYQWAHKWIMTYIGPAAASASVSPSTLNHRCVSHSIPSRSVDQVLVAVRGHENVRPGIARWDHTLQLSFVEDIDATIRRWIDACVEAAWSTGEGLQQRYADLVGTVNLTYLDGLESRPTWQMTLFGVWVQTADFGEGSSGESSEVMRPTVTLTYDYFTQNHSGATGPATGSA